MNKSFHQRTQKEHSFQHILREMNNRVMLSRQARNTVTLKENKFEGMDENKCDYETDREKKTKRLGKTHFGHKSGQSVVDVGSRFMA